ncbi:MAG: hypothetical protein IIV10_05285 [Alistipes sp.]|nr:hypothetical protein [Alistipes sp.]
MKFYTKIVLVALAAIMLGSCFKKVTTDTMLIVKTLIETTSGEDDVAAKEVIAYAYYTGSDDWTVASYEDAVQGIITDSLGVERRTTPDVIASPFERESSTNSYVAMPLNQSPAMVVVVVPEVKMYAYTFRTLEAENLSQTYITLIFHSWKTKEYTEGNKSKGSEWLIFPPAEPLEDEESGEAESPSTY